MQVARVAPEHPAPSLMHRRRVMAEPITYVGLDVHKETIAVALAAAGKRGEVRGYGTIANTPGALKAVADKLAKSGAALRFCYEAGPCDRRAGGRLHRAGGGDRGAARRGR